MIGITLPLALVGAGLLIYLLFKAASHALPLFAGLSAAFGAASAGTSGAAALLFGIAAFMGVIAAGAMSAQLPSPSIRIAAMLLFAVPAGVATFEVASALTGCSGAGILGTVAATAFVATATVAAAKRVGNVRQ